MKQVEGTIWSDWLHSPSDEQSLRMARAARLLPPESRVRVLHAGAALEPELERAARQEVA